MVTTYPYNTLTDFVVATTPSPHIMIIGRPWLLKPRVFLSTYIQTPWYPALQRAKEVRGDTGKLQRNDIISTTWLSRKKNLDAQNLVP